MGDDIGVPRIFAFFDAGLRVEEQIVSQKSMMPCCEQELRQRASTLQEVYLLSCTPDSKILKSFKSKE